MDELLDRMDGVINNVENAIISESKRIININGTLYPPNIDGDAIIKTKVIYDEKNNEYTFQCPYCDEYIVVLAKHLNCKTFRHGSFIPKDPKHKFLLSKYKPINPHSHWKDISYYLTNKCIVGCGGAFKIIGKPKKDRHNLFAVSCGYGKQKPKKMNQKLQSKNSGL